VSISQPSELAQDAGELPGTAVAARIRRLIVVGVLATVAYSFLIVASRGFCPGGAASDSGLTDDAGTLDGTAPTCISITLGPSPVLYVVIAQVWFMLTPLVEWNGAGTFYYPFPFGAVETVISTPTIP